MVHNNCSKTLNPLISSLDDTAQILSTAFVVIETYDASASFSRFSIFREGAGE